MEEKRMISIIERPKLDLKKLDDVIKEYVNANGCNIKYLIMSEETVSELVKILPPFTNSFPLSMNKENYSYLYSYKGIKVAICDGLPFGEVDIV